VRRVEDPRLVQGLGRYSDDVTLPRQAYAVVVRSPHAHARIRGIDPAAARRAPGVLAVLTGADSPTLATCRPTPRAARDSAPRSRPAARADPQARPPSGPGARGGASPEAAADAAELVAVGYAPLPAVTGAARATTAGAPAVWDEAPDNVAFVWEAGSRDAVARGFAGAAHVTRLDFVVTRVAALPLEPRGAVGEFDRRSGRYTLHTGIQGRTASALCWPSGIPRAAEQVEWWRATWRKLRDAERHLSGARAGAVGGEAPGAAGEVDLRPARGLPQRRARPRQRLTAELALDDASGRFLGLRVAQPVDRRVSPPRSAGPATNNGSASPGVTTPAITSETPGVSEHHADGPYRGAGRPGRPTRSSGSSTWRRASSGSTRSSCAVAT
jgi:carbon-monoxide dehydrogenase large subunit